MEAPLSPTGQLQNALRAGAYSLARDLATELAQVPLAEALLLTVLAAEKAPEDFEPMAMRWIERLIEERHISLEELVTAADALQRAGEGDVDRLTLLALTRAAPERRRNPVRPAQAQLRL